MGLTPSEREEILVVATSAAREAGDVLLEFLGKLEAGDIRTKSSSRDLVTAADVAAERHLVRCLRRNFPGHAILSEEEVRDPGAWDAGARWFLDPLDGTVNFVHGIPMFAVSMGLFVDGVPEVAVVHLPRLAETFTAVRGGGTRLGGRPVRVSSATDLGQAIVATGFPYRRNELEHNNLANFDRLFGQVRGLRRLGSAAIDLAYTAAGRIDGYWELHLEPHDVAAGALLVLEAGGLVTDAAGGSDWLFGRNVVAAGAGLHESLRSQVRYAPEGAD